MTLSEALYSHLSSSAGLAALVGERIYPVTAPQADDSEAISPMVVYALLGREHEYTMGDKAMVRDSWLFVAAAANYDTAHAIADAVIAALDRYRGAMPAVSGLQIQTVTIQTARDLDDAAELGIFQVGCEFEIVY